MAKSPYAELPEPLKSQLPIMFSSYPFLKEINPSSWFVWNDHSYKNYTTKVCHSDMRWLDTGFDELITAVPNSSEIDLEYIRMLIRGPFRSFSDLIKLERVKSIYYLHCLALDKWPANVLMNFCIASRVPIEFEYFIPPWAERCNAGFDPTLAYLLTCSYGSTRNKTQFPTRTFDIHRSNHMWFDPASKWSNILNGIIEEPSVSYKEKPAAATPTNIIWGRCNDYSKLMLMTDKEIAEFYTQPIQVYEPPKQPKQVAPKKFNPYQVIQEMQVGAAPPPMPLGAVLEDINLAVAQWQLFQPEPEPQPDGIFIDDPEEPDDEFGFEDDD